MNAKYLSQRCIIVGLLFISPGLLAADTEGQKAIGNIPKEILSIINANQANLDSIHSVDAIIRKESTLSFGANGIRMVEERIRVWDDRDHIRTDRLESRFVGNEKTPLLLTEDGRGDGGGKSYFEAPPVGDVEIRSVEAKTNYYADTGNVFITPPEWRDRDKAMMSDMRRYQTALGETLKYNVIESAKNGYHFDRKHERVDGDDCVLLSCYYPEQKVTLKIWVDPSKGHCIKKVQQLTGGKVYKEYITTLKQYAHGIWWFDSVKERHQSAQNKTVQITVESVIFNEAINTNVFTLAGTDIPHGTRVIDQVTGRISAVP